ncbi:DUF4388 domain-containing protein [Ktedonospora formicarum]|uniref:PatA-like N-terminal domain-containing protein n=1 Tax=Ktedonospora formicarum TaxID=2778364 RepID=A0A8J3HTU1_9CHLR|nr:DUF4388 domain-containing protein [Ktedonospora formicarum]GHO43161.1 hypothetical protein KSX_13240 [Ktedonospora formicarum]
MSLIGTLSQFNFSHVLLRIETYAKSGLLTVAQGSQRVEFYFRDGRLMCIGPVRANTLGERLLQDGVISPQALQQALAMIGAGEASETRVALALMDLQLLGQEELRVWANRKALEVLNVLMLWPGGEVYFDEGVATPPDRLLIALSVSSLLALANVNPLPAQSGSPSSPHPAVSAPVQRPQMGQSQPTPSSISRVQPTPLLHQTHGNNGVAFEAAQTTPNTAFSASATNQPPGSEPPRPSQPVPPQQVVRQPDAEVQAPAQKMSASQMLFDSSVTPTSLPSTEALSPVSQTPDTSSVGLSLGGMLNNVSSTGPLRPEPVMNPVRPPCVDTSFMGPDMVLIPADLSSYRAQNPQFQLTPEQWRLLTRVDGRTALQTACQDLAMLPEMLRQVAGELIAMGLIHVAPAEVLNHAEEMFAASQEAANPMMNTVQGGYVAPGYAATSASPWSPAMPTSPSSPQNGSSFSSPFSFETESQWGNGGNGATFVPGRGWVAGGGPQMNQSTNTTASGVY